MDHSDIDHEKMTSAYLKVLGHGPKEEEVLIEVVTPEGERLDEARLVTKDGKFIVMTDNETEAATFEDRESALEYIKNNKDKLIVRDHKTSTVTKEVPVEGKKAKKDYDGDGEIESPEAEYKGSKDKAIKKSMAKEAHETDGTMICKDCGCELGNPESSCKCPHDAHDPSGLNWTVAANEAHAKVDQFIGHKHAKRAGINVKTHGQSMGGTGDDVTLSHPDKNKLQKYVSNHLDGETQGIKVKESVTKTPGDQGYYHLQRAKKLAAADGHNWDRLPQYHRGKDMLGNPSVPHKDHYMDKAKNEGVNEDHPQANLTKQQRQALASLDKKKKKAITLPHAEFLPKEKEPAKVGRQSQIVKYEGYEADVSKFMDKHGIDHHWSGGKLHVDKKDHAHADKKLEKKYGGYGPRGAKMKPQLHINKESTMVTRKNWVEKFYEKRIKMAEDYKQSPHHSDDATRDTYAKQLSTRKGEEAFVKMHDPQVPEYADGPAVNMKTFADMTKDVKAPTPRHNDHTIGDKTPVAPVDYGKAGRVGAKD